MTAATTPEQPRTAGDAPPASAERQALLRAAFPHDIAAIEAQARPAVASEGLRAAALERALAELMGAIARRDLPRWQNEAVYEQARAALEATDG